MGIFDGIREAKARMDANYVLPSHFVGRINRVKIGKNRKDEGFYVIEMTVVHDFDPDKFQRGIYGHPIGEDVSHMMMSKHDSFLGNVKAFIANTLDIESDQIGEEEAMATAADDQPLAGTLVEVSARLTQTRKGSDFTAINYKGEVRLEDMAAIWAEMGDEGAQRLARFFPDYEAEPATAE